MILCIAYSSRDIEQADRLIQWIQFLSSKHGDSMRKESVLLVPSRPATFRTVLHAHVVDTAAKTFGTARCYIPEGIDESGWPMSPNAMFSAALTHVEHHFPDDILWLEPDAVPLAPDWYEKICAEWDHRDPTKTFMGGLVDGRERHMTGNAIYGKDWRLVAPRLIQATKRPWDVYAATEVMPHTQWTRLIQHQYHRPPPTSLSQLAKGAVIYHDVKDKTLIKLLDRELFKGELYKGQEDIVVNPKIMTTYFKCSNASKSIKSSGFEFIFAKLDNFGGAWRGVYFTNDEAEATVLRSLTPEVGVEEITKEQYEGLLKKKATRSSLRSDPSNEKSPAPSLRVEEKSGVVVENKPARPPETIPQSPATIPESWESVVEMGQVNPPPTIGQTAKKAPVKRKAKEDEE